MNNTRSHDLADAVLSKSIPSNFNQQTSDCGLRQTVHNNSAVNRIGNQTASGDTGDNHSICEQTKWPSIDDRTSILAGKANFASECGMDKNIYACDSSKYTTKNTCLNNTGAENKTNLIINYLPPNMSQEEVRALFSSIGEVESCKLVREKSSGESLGYAFVKFYDPADAGKAIKTINGLRLQNKTVKVSLARPSSEAIKGANLYICGLPRKMTQIELEKLFSSYGQIITARILYDTKTGLSRGVAFIRYDQRAEAEVAIRRLNGYMAPGATEPITVKFANSPSSSRSEHAGYAKFIEADGHSKYNASYGANETNTRSISNGTPVLDTFTSCSSASELHANSSPQAHSACSSINLNSVGTSSTVGCMFPSTRTNFGSSFAPSCSSVCGLTKNVDSPSASNAEGNHSSDCLQSHIVPNGYPVPVSRYSMTNHPGHSRLEGSNVGSIQKLTGARLKSQAAAVAAAMSSGVGIGFRNPNTLLGSPLTSNHPSSLPGFGMEFMRGLGPSAHALLAPAFAASSGALTATGWCIFVYNLAPDTEDSILWQLFGPFGAVQTVKVIRDPATGKCKGFGFVTMSNYEEALLAIHSLNGFNLGNRVLQVSFKTTPNPRQMKYVPNAIADSCLVSSLCGSITPIPGGFGHNI